MQQHGPRSPSPRLWRMRCAEVMGCAVVLAAAAGTGAGLAAGPAAAVIAVGAVAVGAALALWFARNRFRSWAYQERDEDLIVERGVLIRRLSVVPYGRMQFVDVTAGPGRPDLPARYRAAAHGGGGQRRPHPGAGAGGGGAAARPPGRPG